MLTRSTVLLVLLLAPTLAIATTPDEFLETLTESLAAVDYDCGCGMTVLECLHDDPSCRRSPEMARQILAGIVSSEAADVGQSGDRQLISRWACVQLFGVLAAAL